jgi:hypothetical protein
MAILVPRLEPAQRQAVLAEALEAAKAIGNGWDRGGALAALAPYLELGQRQEAAAGALRAVKATIGDKSRSRYPALQLASLQDRATALAALEPYLEPTQRQASVAEALQEANSISHLLARHDNLATLALLKRGELLKAINAMSDSDRWSALAALAPHLEPTQRQAALADARQTAKANSATMWGVEVLTALVPCVEPDQRKAAVAEALQAAKAFGRGDPFRSGALADLAPYLDVTQCAEALRAAQEIGDEDARSKALTALLPHHEPTQRPTAVAEAFQTTMAIGNKHARSDALAVLAPRLDAAQHAEALLAIKATGEWMRYRTLAALVPHLEPAQRRAAVAEALQEAKAIGDETVRCDALAVLVPHLDPTQRPAAVDEALRAAEATGDEEARRRALVALAPYLDVAQCADALRAAKAIRDWLDRSQTLCALAPYLDAAQCADALQTEVITDLGHYSILAALVTHLEPTQRQAAITEALHEARAIGDEQVTGTLAALAPHLDTAQAADALKAAMAIKSEHCRCEALAALVPRLKFGQRHAALAEALQAAKAIQYRCSAFAALVPHLEPGQRQTVLTEALQAAKAIGSELLLCRALKELAPHLDTAQAADALQAAMAIDVEHRRCEALAALVPRLELGQLAEALQAVKSMSDNHRYDDLFALAPQLQPAQRQMVLAESLQAAKAIPDEWVRCDVLMKLAEYVSGALGFDLMITLLDAVSRVERRLALGSASKAATLIVKLGEPSAVADLRRAINDVGRWYP